MYAAQLVLSAIVGIDQQIFCGLKDAAAAALRCTSLVKCCCACDSFVCLFSFCLHTLTLSNWGKSFTHNVLSVALNALMTLVNIIYVSCVSLKGFTEVIILLGGLFSAESSQTFWCLRLFLFLSTLRGHEWGCFLTDKLQLLWRSNP